MSVKAGKKVIKPVEFKYGFRAAKGRAIIELYGQIGGGWFGDGVTAKQVNADLKAAGDVKHIEVRINSPGGDVFEGFGIYNALVRHPASVSTHVDGEAFSAASFILQAGDTREVAESSMVMIHNAYTLAMGDAREMRKVAELLDKNNDQLVQIYVDRTGASDKQVRDWMNAETWWTGEEAVAAGMADSMVENLKVAACPFDPSRFVNMPPWVMERMRNQIGEGADDMEFRLAHARHGAVLRQMITS